MDANGGNVRSGDPVFRCDADMRVVEWNPAAERLTGLRRERAVGRMCWEVVAGRDEDGGTVCHPGCATARLAREGWPVRCRDLVMRTRDGDLRLTISTIVVRVGETPLILHPMSATPAPAAVEEAEEPDTTPQLTPRQLEILRLLSEGLPAKVIAHRLGLAQTTVRNHIQAVLGELGAHSQLEAVFRARCVGVI